MDCPNLSCAFRVNSSTSIYRCERVFCHYAYEDNRNKFMDVIANLTYDDILRNAEMPTFKNIPTRSGSDGKTNPSQQ